LVTAEETVTLYRPVGPKELDAFNESIVGEIEVIAEYRHGQRVDEAPDAGPTSTG
jgi:hypothetical protein